MVASIATRSGQDTYVERLPLTGLESFDRASALIIQGDVLKRAAERRNIIIPWREGHRDSGGKQCFKCFRREDASYHFGHINHTKKE